MTLLYSFLLSILLLCFLVISFFFSLSETSIIAISKIKLRHLTVQKARHSSNVQYLMTHSDRFIVGILIGNNFVNIAFSVILSAICVYFAGPRLGVVIATMLSAVLIMVFCEILPKMIALKNTDRMALAVAPVMEAYTRMITPLAKVFTGTADAIFDVLGIKRTKRSSLITEEELRLMIEVGREDGVLSEEERKMFHRIFEFGDIKVGDVMIPRDKMVAVSISASPEQLLDILAEQGHSRLPVYKGSVENVMGIIYARDLLYILRDKGLFLLQDIVHPAYFVPAQTRVSELLRKFLVDKIQIAVVVDEKSRALGLVTLEDLLEEIVGEIEEQPYARTAK
ncbi:MAG TPA: hemolysin family protein [Candidatus Omnitrophota bacterium]|nr:hemolysin family protein [Candidatus Omnitrophota bacterium]